MKYPYGDAFLSGSYIDGVKFAILENIKRQKRIINNSKSYTKEERELIMKGIDMAFDRAWAFEVERHLI